jgi:hypothetical protein
MHGVNLLRGTTDRRRIGFAPATHPSEDAEVTTTIRDIPQEVRLGEQEGLQRESVANLDNVHVVAKRHLDGLIGVLGPDKSHDVKRALGTVLDWPELKILG